MLQTERINSQQEAFLSMLDGRQALIWTALPGIIQSYDASKNLAVVQPSIQVQLRAQDGTYSWVTIPAIQDVLVMFPSVAGFSITFPIQPNDEGLLIFSSRCIDNWYQQGGIQQPKEMGMHQLTDAFVLPGRLSLPKLISNIDSSNLQIRDDSAGTLIELTPGQVINIKAPGGLNITGDVNITGSLTATKEGTFNGGHTVSAHVHGGVSTGVGQTGTPTG